MNTQYYDEGTGWSDCGNQSIDSALEDLRDDGRIVLVSDTTMEGVRTVIGHIANDLFVLVGAGV